MKPTEEKRMSFERSALRTTPVTGHRSLVTLMCAMGCALLAVIVVIAAFPQIATWLPAVGTAIATK